MKIAILLLMKIVFATLKIANSGLIIFGKIPILPHRKNGEVTLLAPTEPFKNLSDELFKGLKEVTAEKIPSDHGTGGIITAAEDHWENFEVAAEDFHGTNDRIYAVKFKDK